jgi:hypothetical protein
MRCIDVSHKKQAPSDHIARILHGRLGPREGPGVFHSRGRIRGSLNIENSYLLQSKDVCLVDYLFGGLS